MERVMHMDDKKKRILGVLSFIPLVTFLLFTGYLLYIARPLINSGNILDHDALSTLMAENYTTLLVLSGTAFVTGMIMLIYYIIHLARLATMSAGEKLAWMIFMVTFVGISFPIFWYSEVRREPERLRVYPDIA